MVPPCPRSARRKTAAGAPKADEERQAALAGKRLPHREAGEEDDKGGDLARRTGEGPGEKKPSATIATYDVHYAGNSRVLIEII